MDLEKYIGKTSLFETNRFKTSRNFKQQLRIGGPEILPHYRLSSLARNQVFYTGICDSAFSYLAGLSLRGLDSPSRGPRTGGRPPPTDPR